MHGATRDVHFPPKTAETPLTASIVGDRVVVSQTIVPIDRLGEVPECGLIRTPTDLKTTALASWERTFVCERNRWLHHGAGRAPVGRRPPCPVPE